MGPVSSNPLPKVRSGPLALHFAPQGLLRRCKMGFPSCFLIVALSRGESQQAHKNFGETLCNFTEICPGGEGEWGIPSGALLKFRDFTAFQAGKAALARGSAAPGGPGPWRPDPPRRAGFPEKRGAPPKRRALPGDFLQFHELVFPGADAQRGGSLHDEDAVAGLDALQQVGAAGVLGGVDLV